MWERMRNGLEGRDTVGGVVREVRGDGGGGEGGWLFVYPVYNTIRLRL